MSFECNFEYVSGIKPEVSCNALKKSYQETSNPQYYKKHQYKIEEYFQNKIQENISQAQIPDYLANTLEVNFKSDGIYFQSNSEQALKYEFGAGKTPPKNFIEPAMIETANEVSQMVITDAIDLYNKYIK